MSDIPSSKQIYILSCTFHQESRPEEERSTNLNLWKVQAPLLLPFSYPLIGIDWNLTALNHSNETASTQAALDFLCVPPNTQLRLLFVPLSAISYSAALSFFSFSESKMSALSIFHLHLMTGYQSTLLDILKHVFLIFSVYYFDYGITCTCPIMSKQTWGTDVCLRKTKFVVCGFELCGLNCIRNWQVWWEQCEGLTVE